MASALSGAMAIPAAAGIVAAAGCLAYLRQAYIFSLSYGLAMCGIGSAVLMASPPSLVLKAHAGLVIAYGARLFGFLLWRQRFQRGYDGEARLKALDKTPKLQRTPIILSISIFYAFMSSPLVFHFQSAPLLGVAAKCSTAGSMVAAVGLACEAIADLQKSFFKMGLRAANKPDALYTGGLYSFSRHANYLGEMTFWLGSFIAGLPAILASGLSLHLRAFQLSVAALGLSGIFFIMLSATKRLEASQAEKYRPSYDEYFRSTNALLPRLVKL